MPLDCEDVAKGGIERRSGKSDTDIAAREPLRNREREQ
jgi:hypothetical protein